MLLAFARQCFVSLQAKQGHGNADEAHCKQQVHARQHMERETTLLPSCCCDYAGVWHLVPGVPGDPEENNWSAGDVTPDGAVIYLATSSGQLNIVDTRCCQAVNSGVLISTRCGVEGQALLPCIIIVSCCLLSPVLSQGRIHVHCFVCSVLC